VKKWIVGGVAVAILGAAGAGLFLAGKRAGGRGIASQGPEKMPWRYGAIKRLLGTRVPGWTCGEEDKRVDLGSNDYSAGFECRFPGGKEKVSVLYAKDNANTATFVNRGKIIMATYAFTSETQTCSMGAIRQFYPAIIEEDLGNMAAAGPDFFLLHFQDHQVINGVNTKLLVHMGCVAKEKNVFRIIMEIAD
jgi:hypothetical protein